MNTCGMKIALARQISQADFATIPQILKKNSRNSGKPQDREHQRDPPTTLTSEPGHTQSQSSPTPFRSSRRQPSASPHSDVSRRSDLVVLELTFSLCHSGGHDATDPHGRSPWHCRGALPIEPLGSSGPISCFPAASAVASIRVPYAVVPLMLHWQAHESRRCCRGAQRDVLRSP